MIGPESLDYLHVMRAFAKSIHEHGAHRDIPFASGANVRMWEKTHGCCVRIHYRKA